MQGKYWDQLKAYVVTAYPDADRKYPGMFKTLISFVLYSKQT